MQERNDTSKPSISIFFHSQDLSDSGMNL